MTTYTAKDRAECIFKYPLRISDWVSLAMPEDAEVLCVQVQHDVPCLWVRVTPGVTLVDRRFRIAGTGHDLGDNVGRYIGTFQCNNGQLVFHVFEELRQ